MKWRRSWQRPHVAPVDQGAYNRGDMSLLTDEDIRKATFIPDEYGDPDFCVTLFGKDRDRAIADAEHSLTLKAVVEWGNATCWNGLHSEENIIAVRQMECPDCRDGLLEAAAKGKMPGEEK